ncbi:MAG TPA: D-glucuronyl C5-epimerase family protein [Solirubrobacteraceae bacterium]|nr:D-glucuronyl C5-epimerase family protein [Solirubrobacteraceae bacterium]
MTDSIALCYHALSSSWDADLCVLPERFERQVELLIERGFRGVRFAELVNSAGRDRVLAVTFDDGYRSVIEIALPILSRFGLPATVFVPTDYIGTTGKLCWPGIDQWGDGRFEDELRPMSWAELDSLAAAGWEIGSHSGSHANLTQLGDVALADELTRSKAACEEHLRRSCVSLAYPYGDVDDRVVAAAARAGYVAGGTLPRRSIARGALEWPRIGVYRFDDDLRFSLKVSSTLRRVRRSGAWNVVAGSRPISSESASSVARASHESRRSDGGFFSNAKSFFLPLGPAIDPRSVSGYPIDLRVKARSTDWRPVVGHVGHYRVYVAIAQYGLGAYERWLGGEGEEWLVAARAVGTHLLSRQEPDGSWLQHEPLPHTFPLIPPWCCAMSQGEGASLLVRLYSVTGDEQFAEAARLALGPLSRSCAEGGVSASLDGRPWLEEYPTDPPSFVLNGAMFALWGLRDVGVALVDAEAIQTFEAGVDALAASLHRFDNGWWSLYSLFPHPVRGVASSFYHDLHMTQLLAMDVLSPRPEFEPMRRRWITYASSLSNRRRAFASKAVFRILVPRNRFFARRMPWTRVGRVGTGST